VLASGSTGNAIYVSTGNTRLLVDCGLVAKEVKRRLEQLHVDPHLLDGILISHAHGDHYKSAGTIHARYGAEVYTTRGTLDSIRDKRTQYSFWRIPKVLEIPARIGDIRISTFTVPHYFYKLVPGDPVGFVLRHGRKKVGIVTDIGRVTPEVTRALKGSDVLVIEANHHEPIVKRKLKDPSFSHMWIQLRWLLTGGGHLSNQQCGAALTRILSERTGHVFLAHMSINHRDPRDDNNSFRLAKGTVKRVLEEEGVPVPELLKTYRRDRTEGKRSKLVTV
jgi:phosphoribosyl 1,2-cyclic phosphodiesterase